MIHELTREEIEMVSGGIDLEGRGTSNNVESQRLSDYVAAYGPVQGPAVWASVMAGWSPPLGSR